MIDVIAEAYLGKAEESLAGAESELAAGRGNNAASRAYYAAFQAAVAALVVEQVEVIRGPDGTISRRAVAAGFVGLLVRRRRLYDAGLSRVLPESLELRHKADYRQQPVTLRQAARAVRAVRQLVQAISGVLRSEKET